MPTVVWGPTFMRAASEVWQIKTADTVSPEKRQKFKDKNISWGAAAMTDSADDAYYLGELRHALTNIVSRSRDIIRMWLIDLTVCNTFQSEHDCCMPRRPAWWIILQGCLYLW